ncbi:MAG: hypothetical protein WDZ84_05670 [Rhodovibrionaceae bacterium]
MDRLSNFTRTASFDSSAALGDLELRRNVERGRRLQREALRSALRDAGQAVRRLLCGWGEARLSHPRSRAEC